MLIYECDSCGKKIRDKRQVYRVDFHSPVSIEMDKSGDDELDLSEGFHIMQVVDRHGMVSREIFDHDFYLCPECAECFMRDVHYGRNGDISFKSVAPNV